MLLPGAIRHAVTHQRNIVQHHQFKYTPSQPQGAVFAGQNIANSGLICPTPAESAPRRLHIIPDSDTPRRSMSRALSTDVGAQAPLTSKSLLVMPGNGTVFCANADADEEIGELVLDNTDESRIVTVRVAWRKTAVPMCASCSNLLRSFAMPPDAV